MNKRTFIPKIDVQRRQWRVVDANGVVLGRLAVQIADALRGKDKPTFSPTWMAATSLSSSTPRKSC